jgi:hypothetical protein
MPSVAGGTLARRMTGMRDFPVNQLPARNNGRVISFSAN